MPDVNSVIQRLEGYISTFSGDETQACSVWLENVKAIMRAPVNRDKTDWDAAFISSVVNNTTNTLATTGTLYAMLLSTIEDRAERSWVAVYDNTTQTFDGTAALDNSVIDVTLLPQAASGETVKTFVGKTYGADGFALATGLSVTCDGRDGADIPASDVTAAVVYRTP